MERILSRGNDIHNEIYDTSPDDKALEYKLPAVNAIICMHRRYAARSVVKYAHRYWLYAGQHSDQFQPDSLSDATVPPAWER